MRLNILALQDYTYVTFIFLFKLYTYLNEFLFHYFKTNLVKVL